MRLCLLFAPRTGLPIRRRWELGLQRGTVGRRSQQALGTAALWSISATRKHLLARLPLRLAAGTARERPRPLPLLAVHPHLMDDQISRPLSPIL